MRLILPIVGVLALSAVPAFAQQSGTMQNSGAEQNGATAAQTQRQTISPESRQKLLQALQQAGFKDIKILDTAYLVHARTKNGSFVAMYINRSTTGNGSTVGMSSSANQAAQNQQPQNQQTKNQQTQNEAMQSQQSQQQAENQPAENPQARRAESPQQLRQTLSQAGFQNIQVVDAAYIVQAQTQDGNTVMMYINPPNVSGTSGSSNAPAQSGSSMQQQ